MKHSLSYIFFQPFREQMLNQCLRLTPVVIIITSQLALQTELRKTPNHHQIRQSLLPLADLDPAVQNIDPLDFGFGAHSQILSMFGKSPPFNNIGPSPCTPHSDAQGEDSLGPHSLNFMHAM